MKIMEDKIQLIMALRRHGITDARVLSAIERIPREDFVSEEYRDRAYEDYALPIDCGQTISQPFVVAYMTEKLSVGPRDTVLEIGTGSGYQAAVLSQLCRRVYTVERYRTLLKKAEQRFEKLGLANITTMLADGTLGWNELAPFDRIIVTAVGSDISQVLVDQLKVGGILVAPIAESQEDQRLIRLTKTDEGTEVEKLVPVRFVPLVRGIAQEL
jgi:protein-L-isoaspartate(D-aspartate) O-methyltransferase